MKQKNPERKNPAEYLVSSQFARDIYNFGQTAFVTEEGEIYKGYAPRFDTDVALFGPLYDPRGVLDYDEFDIAAVSYVAEGVDSRKTWVTLIRDAVTVRAKRTGRIKEGCEDD